MNPYSQKYIRDENISDNSEENNIIERKNSLPVNKSINYHTYGEEKNEKFLKSKIIQNDYEKGDLIKKEEIFENAINNLKEMISDTYDNYILQKILERGLWIHKKRLFDEIKTDFLDFSLQKYGCRVIQKTIEAFQEPNTEEFDFIFNKIRDNISTLILHENGNFIIQKCLEVYQKDYFRFVLDCINEKLPILSSHKYGCLIIQKLSEIYKDKDENIKNEIDYVIMKILAVSHELSKKEYSNYIIQHLLEAGHCSHKDKLLNNYILPNFIALSCDQFASNVAEKAIIFSDRQFRCNLWNTLSISKENVLKLVNDRYGNYVMQRVYEYSDNDIRMEFAKFLDMNYNYLSAQAQYVLKFIQKFK